MKTDRLYGITVYLLNHGKTTGAALAKRFEVSLRTVQRDIDALCRAGIPVAAEAGSEGGYYLADTFRLEAQTATKEDYALIRTALRGYSTAMGDPKIKGTLEKLSALSGEKDEEIILDFSVLREGDEALLQTLQTAIREKNPIRFTYTNAENVVRTHTVEPIALVYRWYAWYLLAYSRVKDDYRTYKLVRMEQAQLLQESFTKIHGCPEAILREKDDASQPPCTVITVRCRPEARARAVEYLEGDIVRENADGTCDMQLKVIEQELFWFGCLLSLGNGVEVLEPPHIRQRLLNRAKEVVTLYQSL